MHVLVLWMLCGAALPLAAADGPRRVLLIHSFGRDFTPFSEVSAAFRAGLAERSDAAIEFMDASLEMSRFDGIERDGPLLDFLLDVFSDSPPDLIVPLGAPAGMFLARHRARLFPAVPVLVLSADKRRLPRLEQDPMVTAVGLDLDLASYLDNIRTLLPETRDIHVILGSTPLERFWEQELRREWTARAADVRFHWLSDRSVAAACASIRKLPPGSAVMVGIISRDAAGIPHESESALQAIHAASAAPVFGYARQQLGNGIVGGPLAPLDDVGREGARVALRLLGGEAPAAIPVRHFPLLAPAYDARELERWDIPASRLPAGAAVLFDDAGLWQDHRGWVLGALGFILVQSALIGLLVAARRRARETAASLTLAAEAAEIGLWRRPPRSCEFLASERWRKVFGLPDKGRIPQAMVLERLHPDDRGRLLQSIEHAAATGDGFAMEHRVVLDDGSVRWLSTHGRADGGGNGHDFGTRGASIDITARREAAAAAARQQQQLAHLSRVSSLGVLSGALAHELNQPLGIILSNAQAAEVLLEREPADLQELKDIVADIVREDRRAGDVIKRLRTLLRPHEAQLLPLDLNDCVREILALTRSDLIGRGIATELELDGALPPVWADRVHVQQVLLNLVMNACDAMQDPGATGRVLRLETRAGGDEVHLEVIDQGPGLPSDPEVIFAPFHTTKPQGLGMGLAICRALVESHRGRIVAEPAPAGGACFRVSFPLSPPP
jgi:signal transduction histidine kinase